jgi:hypothetical protein
MISVKKGKKQRRNNGKRLEKHKQRKENQTKCEDSSNNGFWSHVCSSFKAFLLFQCLRITGCTVGKLAFCCGEAIDSPFHLWPIKITNVATTNDFQLIKHTRLLIGL